ncbi:hypothetical protein [Streptomyces sp. NPDC054783]
MIIMILLLGAFDGAAAVAQAEPGDHGAQVLVEAVDEAVKDRQVVGLDALDPLAEVPALAVVHQLGERWRSRSGAPASWASSGKCCLSRFWAR